MVPDAQPLLERRIANKAEATVIHRVEGWLRVDIDRPDLNEFYWVNTGSQTAKVYDL